MTLQVLFDTGGANSVKNLKIGGISREIDKLDAEQCSRGWRYESCHHFRLENSIYFSKGKLWGMRKEMC